MFKNKLIIVLGSVLCMFAVGLVVATTTDISSGSGAPAYSAKAFVIKKTVNFATHPVASNDVLQVINVASNWMIDKVYYKTTTASTNAAAQSPTINIGDGDSVSRFVASGMTTNTTLGTSISAAASNKVYQATDTIDVKAEGTINYGIVDIYVVGRDLN